MNEISPAAIEAAKLATAEALGDSFEALARRIQREHDSARILRDHCINEIGLDIGSRFVRILQTMMIEGVDPFRKRDFVAVEPCPLCNEKMVPEIMGGSRQWRHPFEQGDTAAEACPLTHFRVTPLQVPKWNARPRNKPANQTINSAPCRVCHSSTPATASAICGRFNCPHREN